MNHLIVEPDMFKTLRKHSIIAGIILLIIGVVGIFLPALMALTISMFIGWLLLFGGIIAGYHVFNSYKKRGLAWLKPFILIATGILLLLYPFSGIAAIGLLLAVYFLIDAFAGFSFAFELRPIGGWGWMFFNGLISLTLAIIFLIGWPLNSLWLVGLVIGISLFMDGITLLVIGISAGKI